MHSSEEDNVRHEQDDTDRQITLDLTVPYDPSEHQYIVGGRSIHGTSTAMNTKKTGGSSKKDEDILAGCNALLSFSNQHTTIGTK